MKKLLIGYTLLLLAPSLKAQIGLGITTPHPNAYFQVNSTNKGILLPRMTALQRLAIAPNATANGLLVFDTDSSAFMFWTGTNWRKMSSSLESELWKKTGNDIYNGNTGRVGIGTNNPLAKLHVADSSVVFGSNTTFSGFPVPNPPISGEGTRMMWYAELASFRAGAVTDNSWDRDSTGLYSAAFGYNSRAYGLGSLAVGSSTSANAGGFASGVSAKAYGYNSVATGFLTLASGASSAAFNTQTAATGENAFASGKKTLASGYQSFASGEESEATGNTTTAMGYKAHASGSYAMAIGENTYASFPHTFAGGYLSSASGNYAFAYGNNALANGKDLLHLATLPSPTGHTVLQQAIMYMQDAKDVLHWASSTMIAIIQRLFRLTTIAFFNWATDPFLIGRMQLLFCVMDQWASTTSILSIIST